MPLDSPVGFRMVPQVAPRRESPYGCVLTLRNHGNPTDIRPQAIPVRGGDPNEASGQAAFSSLIPSFGTLTEALSTLFDTTRLGSNDDPCRDD